MEIIIIGKPINKYFTNDSWCPFCAAILATTTFALAPTRVPFPPKQAPKDKLHHKGSRFVSPIVLISLIIGIDVYKRQASQ